VIRRAKRQTKKRHSVKADYLRVLLYWPPTKPGTGSRVAPDVWDDAPYAFTAIPSDFLALLDASAARP
jgi:hypothetical protein